MGGNAGDGGDDGGGSGCSSGMSIALPRDENGIIGALAFHDDRVIFFPLPPLERAIFFPAAGTSVTIIESIRRLYDALLTALLRGSGSIWVRSTFPNARATIYSQEESLRCKLFNLFLFSLI